MTVVTWKASQRYSIAIYLWIDWELRRREFQGKPKGKRTNHVYSVDILFSNSHWVVMFLKRGVTGLPA